MATVRLGTNLKDEILKKARNVFNKRLAAASENHPQDWAERIYNGMFDAETREKMESLPKFFFNYKERLGFNGFNEDYVYEDGTEIRLRISISDQSLGGSKPFPYAYDKPELGIQHTDYSGDVLLKGDDPRWAELREEVAAYKRAIYDIEKERDEFVKGVDDILEAYATLAPALRAWPPLWDLLPESTKRKHKEIVERKKSARQKIDRPEISADLDRMSAAVIANKLQGGS